jgi:hypothetical protein
LKPLNLILPVLILLSGPAEAATLIGLTTTNALVKFDSASPGTLLAGPTAITGLGAGDTIRAIEYRPANGLLYGLSSASLLYVINEVTGVAMLVGAFTPSLIGTEFGFDVIPVTDRIRVLSDANQNFRLNPDTGNLSVADSPLSYAAGDSNFGVDPNVTAAAHTNSHAGATTTTLFAIDTSLDILVRSSNPNGGLLVTVGAMGVNTSSLTGFDIDPLSGVAFAALDNGALQSSLYALSLTNGAATLIGTIAAGSRLRGLTARPFASALVGLTTANALIQFNADAPGTIVAGPTTITGLDPGEFILSIDYRSATGGLYGLSNLSRLFRLNAATGAATLTATLTSSLTGTAWGLDFNPSLDSLRIVSNGGGNLFANPDTGAVTVQTPLMFAAGDVHAGTPPSLAGSAYINTVFNTATTLLYGIDNSLDALVTQTPPANGTLNTVGALGVDAVGDLGFDIEPVLNSGWAAMVVGGTSRLYKINIHSGAATLIGAIGGGHHLRGLTFVLFGATPPATIVALGTTAGGPRVGVLFSPVVSAHHYDVYRRAAGGAFEHIGSTFATQYLDTGVVANTSYLYKVRAVGPGGNSTPDSGAEVGTPISFTDDPMLGVLLAVKAVHLAELRAGVNLVRALAGLAPATVTDAASPGVVVKAIHITELRVALDAARAALGVPAVTYSRTLTPGATLIDSTDFIELRTGIR